MATANDTLAIISNAVWHAAEARDALRRDRTNVAGSLDRARDGLTIVLAEVQKLLIPADAEVGMRWYNALTEAERRHWHAVAGSAVPADAWAAFKAGGHANPD